MNGARTIGRETEATAPAVVSFPSLSGVETPIVSPARNESSRRSLSDEPRAVGFLLSRHLLLLLLAHTFARAHKQSAGQSTDRPTIRLAVDMPTC